ncbi:MAG: DUF4132 domain-containing protein [Archangium sp.]|nr:DUF4132 domain-containing protein [Archangium sp.]
MRFTLQEFVEPGLRESPLQLRLAGEAVSRAVRTGDWSTLDLDAQAAAVVMGKPEQTSSWLASLPATDPVRALRLALLSARLTLRFSMSEGSLARVLDYAVRKPAAQLPPPSVWLSLRRAFDAAPLLRTQGRAALTPELDLRLRAATAFVFPEDPRLWTEEEHRRGLAIEEPSDAVFILFATLRDVPAVAASLTWPPPSKLLKNLPDAQLEEALLLIRDDTLASQQRRRESAKQASHDVAPHLANITAADALATLAMVTPTEDLLAQAEAFVEAGAPEELILRRSFIEGWKRELRGLGVDRDAPWTSPWGQPRRTGSTEPPPGPPLLPGAWERNWRPRPVPPEVLLAWTALSERADVRPWEIAFILAMGPSVLPRLRAWARRDPVLLAATQEVDDVGLDEALLLAWNSRRVQLSLAAREFARRFPERAHHAAIRLCFSSVQRERAVGVVVLRALEREASNAIAALEPEQRGWIGSQLSASPPLPARRPSLPEFLRFSVLPAVFTHDQAHALNEEALRELLAVFKVAPPDDSSTLLHVTAGLSSASLQALAGAVFHQWLAAGAPPKDKWALNALAHFPSDDWATVVGASCQQWAQGGFPARAQDAVAVLGRMGTRVALAEVHRLSTRIRTVALRARARLAFHEAASRLGLSPEELEDRLVPEVGPLDGATLSLDGALRPVLMKEGKEVPVPDAVKRAAKSLKPALARLERAMSEGAAFSAFHFTETWGMHPLLRELAARVVWGVFKNGQRVGLFVPSTPPQGETMPLDESTQVRPVHPLELSEEEKQRARAWFALRQPFEQLERAVYPATELRQRLRALVDREVPVMALLALERLGWERGAVADGGSWMDLTRRGDGWSVALHFEPGIWAGDPSANELQLITGVDPEGALSPRVSSEIQRDLVSLSPTGRGLG